MSDNVDWDKKIDSLKRQPNENEIKSILNHFSKNPSDKVIFQLITTLLNHTIPESYNSLSKPIQQDIIRLFRSLVGLGNLVTKISVLTSTDQNHVLVKLYLEILLQVFDKEIVLELIKSNPNPVEVKEIDRLIFKGKIFSVLNEVYVSTSLDVDYDVFSNSDRYVNFLSTSILSLYQSHSDIKLITSFVTSLIGFNSNSVAVFFGVMFNHQNWQYFMLSFNVMKSYQKKEILIKFFTIYLKPQFSNKVNIKKISSLFTILEFTGEYFDENNIEKVILSLNYSLNILVSKIVSAIPEVKLNALTLRLINNWSDQTKLKSEPIIQQEFRTHFLVNLLRARKGSKFIQDLMQNRIFLDAITHRLESFSGNVKTLGVIFANKVCEYDGKPKIFDEESSMYTHLLDEPEPFVNMRYEEAWSNLSAPRVEEPVNVSTSVQLEKAKVNDISQVDSDDDDDDEMNGRANIPTPLYIKDLLKYLTIDEKAKQAYEMRRVALTTGPSLMRQKMQFGNEVDFYAEDLIVQLLGLGNHFDEKDFDTLKLNCLVSVLVASPDSALHICKLLLTGDYSLQQRMMILSTISLATRELRGLTDDVISKSFNQTNFPTKLLPPKSHEAFISMDDESTNVIKYLNHSLQDDLMLGVTENEENKLSNNGQILKISKGFKNRNENKMFEQPRRKDFYKIIGPRFFYPLVNVWYEAGEIDIGHYSTVFIGHYINTLTLVVHCAYPSSNDLRDMVKEFIQLTTPLIHKVKSDEIQVIESIVTGIFLICDIVEEDYIIQEFHNSILQYQSWLSQIWETLIDSKLKSLCAGLLLRLNNLLQQFERTLLIGVNSMY
ncbi:telomere length regulation protein-domain-containing protein [Scheffersomyces coipomensis]|uniref:telomere length regulation protein-domain-containing protein n=1 Tax=Scheffersomyces coipomensis TaxID=1788519 RepID=UPI00315DB141